MNLSFDNAQEAFEYQYNFISEFGEDFSGTKCLFNEGFTIRRPLDNNIYTTWRNWNPSYAQYEWEWYLSGDPSGVDISKKAKIWEKCMDENGNVNSNYGYQWNRGYQLEYIVRELMTNPGSRRASISIYDAKDRHNFENDTPCTYAINFTIFKGKLNMSVMMRSNDLWYGFCNDQYCFSELLRLVASKLNIPVGEYYHFANNLHIYNKFLNKTT